MDKEKLNNHTTVDRKKYSVGAGKWQGLKIIGIMILNDIDNTEYEIVSENNETYVITNSKEAEEIMEILGF